MIEIFKKTYLAGADFAHKTWDEVEARANDVIKRPNWAKKRELNF